MKAPNLKKLSEVESEDQFTKIAQEERSKASVGIRKTFSLQQQDFDYINAEALKMSQELGKVVSASQALRYIIQRDRSART